MDTKKNWPLLVGIAIPVAMILFVAASIYLPALFTDPPQHDFVYLTGDVYSSQFEYLVTDGRIERREYEMPKEPPYPYRGTVHIIYYNVSENKGREINYEEAQKLKLDASIKSPDGFEVVTGTGGDFPFGGGGSYGKHFLSKGAYSKELIPQSSEDRFNFRFLGWVVK